MPRVLVTGASGYVGAALIPRLQAAGQTVRAFARDPARVTAAGVDVAGLEIATGDAVSGAGLDAALDGIDVAYFLIHSMESGAAGWVADRSFRSRDRRAAERFAEAARRAGVRRVVYLGGLVPDDGVASDHLASRLEVEQTLLEAAPEALALRASIVIGARSRSFRFLVRLVERVPVMPLPAWRENRTQPDRRPRRAVAAGRRRPTRRPSTARCRSTSPAPTSSPTASSSRGSGMRCWWAARRSSSASASRRSPVASPRRSPARTMR